MSLDGAQGCHWLVLTFLWEIMVLSLGCMLESSGELYKTLTPSDILILISLEYRLAIEIFKTYQENLMNSKV